MHEVERSGIPEPGLEEWHCCRHSRLDLESSRTNSTVYGSNNAIQFNRRQYQHKPHALLDGQRLFPTTHLHFHLPWRSYWIESSITTTENIVIPEPRLKERFQSLGWIPDRVWNDACFEVCAFLSSYLRTTARGRAMRDATAGAGGMALLSSFQT